jgi:hypothetical protein
MTVVKRLLLAGAIALGVAALGFVGSGVASAGTSGGNVFIQQSPSTTAGNQQSPDQQSPQGHCDHDGGSTDSQNQQSGFLRG